MITRDSLKDHFEELGIDVTDQVLDKCVEICILYNIDEETFVETWMAYSITNCSGEPPTLETIAQMERKELAKQNNTSLNASTSRQPTTPLIVYNSSTSTSSKSASIDHSFDTTPKGKGDRNFANGESVISRSSRNLFSPASYSPLAANPSTKYINRINAGEVVCTFGEHGQNDANWKGDINLAVNICPYSDELLLASQKVMLESLSDKAAILKYAIEHIGCHLVETHGLAKPLIHGTRSHGECVCLGRICCDSDGHLNSSSVLLEGSSGVTTKLDLSKISQYATFPGQIVAVEGTNPSGSEFLAQKIYSSAVLPPPQLAPQFPKGSLQMVVACGPFTQTDNLAYQPMEDLSAYILSHKPHVVVLIGPLVNVHHPLIVDGSLAETFEELYDKIVSGIMEPLKGSEVKVVIVSSCQDSTALPIYPTPPPIYKHKYPNLSLVSDPSLISISGVVVCITATDSLMHLGKEEMAFPAGGRDRLGRLASHLLEQQSFYPLYPSNEDLSVDSDLWESHAFFPVTPHILVIPSDLRYFIKFIHGCVVVNPERLAKGQVGGSFVRIEVKPEIDGLWSPATHISAQIVKI